HCQPPQAHLISASLEVPFILAAKRDAVRVPRLAKIENYHQCKFYLFEAKKSTQNPNFFHFT
ncbi:MAG: hypothetical protein LUD69_05750, partial [Oscillospiraceae bacterium]|nr:hypothetical protein [Oscillospiraceae bacterium]